MAKFKAGDLDFKTGQKIDFNDANDVYMGYDTELYINSTVSGIRAFNPWHLVRYDQLTQASGSLQDQIDNISISGVGVDEFVELTDTPSTYAGTGNYVTVVNPSEDGLRFVSQAEATQFYVYEDSVFVSPFASLNFISASVSGSSTISGALDIDFEQSILDTIDGFWGEEVGEVSTTSTAWQERMSIEVIPSFTATYLFSFSTMVSHEDTGVFCKLRIQINDSITRKESWLELYNFKYSDGAYQIWSGTFSYPLVTGTIYNVDLDYASGDSGVSMYLKESSMAAQRLLAYEV